MPKNMGKNKIFEDGIARISQEDVQRLAKYILQAGDIVLPRRGDLSRYAYVTDEYAGWLCGTGCLRIRMGNEFIDTLFLTYHLAHPSVLKWILSNAVGTTMPNLSTAIVRRLPVSLPPLPEQKAIAHILGALDDKIELNRQMNQTLEAMARAIFKSWFVDFDPVRAKLNGEPYPLDAETLALFPDRFVDSEMGEIPEGWEVGSLSAIVDFVLGGDWGKTPAQKQWIEPAFCIRGADIPNLQSGGMGKMPIRYLKSSSLQKRSLKDGDIVIEISGGSPTQSTARPVLVTSRLLERFELPLVCSNFCRMVRTTPDIPSTYIYLWLRWLYSRDMFLQYETGTTGIKNFAYTIFSQEYPLLIPPQTILHRFAEIANPLFELRQRNGGQSRTLAELRDTLLPKLISGELRVPEAENITEELTA